MRVRQLALLGGLAFTFAACARQQTEADTGEIEPSVADTAATENMGGQNPENEQTVSDSAKANQDQSGVTNTETGEGTLGEGVTELEPTEGEITTEQRQKLEEAGQDSAWDQQNEPVGQQQADTTGQQSDTTMQHADTSMQQHADSSTQ